MTALEILMKAIDLWKINILKNDKVHNCLSVNLIFPVLIDHPETPYTLLCTHLLTHMHASSIISYNSHTFTGHKPDENP